MIKTIIKTSEYHDSVTLMLVAKELAGFPGVQDAAVVMGTEANKSIIDQSGLLTDEAKSATPNDLIIVIKTDGSAEAAFETAEELLQKKSESGGGMQFKPRTIRSAVRSLSGANMAIISIAGRYAADEAWEALKQGLHVLLFSDNVSLEDEVALKKYARDHGLLLMGSGAGTAIINGVALAFANVIPPGPVGIVAAAGTGLQETSTLLAKYGIGITQGIGTGGRDLKKEVGGIMFLEGLKALQEDPQTKVILLVSKPPSQEMVEKVLERVMKSSKPTVVCLLGGDISRIKPSSNIFLVTTLQEAALQAARLAGAELDDPKILIAREMETLSGLTSELKQELQPGQKFLRALFSGGTLCAESLVIWRDEFKKTVYSNAPLSEDSKLKNSIISEGNCAVDLGEEEFTVGRPHPMIDNDLRVRRILQEARDPGVAVIMLDVVIGYGAHPDPAQELGKAITQGKQIARDAGRELHFVTSVTGTEGDPQVLSKTVEKLRSAGAIVLGSNAAAARLTAMLIS